MNNTTAITANKGIANAIQRKKEMFIPRVVRMIPIPIRLGGVPTGVPIPPIEAPYAIMSIIPVA